MRDQHIDVMLFLSPIATLDFPHQTETDNLHQRPISENGGTNRPHNRTAMEIELDPFHNYAVQAA